MFSLYTDDDILKDLHKLIHECADVTTQYDLKRGRVDKAPIDVPESPPVLEPLQSSSLEKEVHELGYEPVRHLHISCIATSDIGAQCYIVDKNEEIQCVAPMTFCSVQTDEPDPIFVKSLALEPLPANIPDSAKQKASSKADNPTIALLIAKLEACDHTLTKRTEKYTQLKSKFGEARKLNEELLKQCTTTEQRALEQRKELEELIRYKEGVEETLIPSLKELKCTNDALTENFRATLQDKERLILEVEQKGLDIDRLQENLREAQKQLSSLIALHPQIILKEKGTCTHEDNIYCTNTREVLTDFDATNASIFIKQILISKAVETEDVSGVQTIEERSKGLQTKTRKLKESDQQYCLQDTEGLVCPPLAVWSKDMCTQTTRLVLTAEEEAVLKNGGSIECSKCTNLNQRIAELERRNTNLLDDLKLTEEERDDADDKLAALTRKYNEKRNAYISMEKDLKSTEEALEEYKNRTKASQDTLEKQEQIVISLKKELEIRNAEILKLAEACTALENARDNAIRAHESTQHKLTSLKKLMQEIKE